MYMLHYPDFHWETCLIAGLCSGPGLTIMQESFLLLAGSVNLQQLKVSLAYLGMRDGRPVPPEGVS